jgi:hypothetical protein
MAGPSGRRSQPLLATSCDQGNRLMSSRPTMQLRHSRHQRIDGATPVERYGERRVCSAVTCTTVLSRYNPSPTCSRHAGWEDQHSRRMG